MIVMAANGEKVPVPPRTYGKKPDVFQFEEGGDTFMIGSEVCEVCLKLNYLKYVPEMYYITD